ncbi:MAG TPA: SgcJ/EcaC family oxidoreductase [Nostocaceae cyanobacterium]|nr:SgcJ/EcaC family oxidoreductase [Nostocaceae cyanobacterium]
MSQAEQEIKTNMQAFAAAWSVYDAKKLASLFVEDADFVNVFGHHLKGKSEIEQGHAQAFVNNLKDTILNFTQIDIKFIQPDLAICHSYWDLEKVNSNQPPKKGIITALTIQKDGKWQILAVHNTETVSLPFNPES